MAELKLIRRRFVERDADEPCCSSCRHEEEGGLGLREPDYCCCVHGTAYGIEWDDGRVSWAYDDAEEKYRALTASQGEVQR